MTPSILKRLDAMAARHNEVTALLSDPEVINNQEQYRELGREHAHLEKVIVHYREYNVFNKQLASTETMLQDKDEEVKTLAQDENDALKKQLAEIELEIRHCLLPHDPHDHSNIFLEIRAGTGGDEAAIFAGDLFRMYSRYAENKKWDIDIINSNEGEHGGFKEIISRIIGEGAYSFLKF